MSKSSKIFGSLFNSVLNQIEDGIKNVIENAEITQELCTDPNDNQTKYSIHINIGNNKLNALDINIENKEFNITDGILRAYRGNKKNVTIPDNVVEIGDNAFKGKKIHSISIPDSVLIIGENAFKDCIKLKTIHFGEHIQKIKNSAFENCYQLTSAELPDSLESIGERTFAENWNLHHVVLPKSLKSLPDELFIGCRGLKLIQWPENLQTVGKNIFSDCVEPDLWQYFTLENGTCYRTSADQEQFDPDGFLTLDFSYYSLYHSRNLLNWIWKDFPFNPNLVFQRMEFFKKSIYFTIYISSCNLYAVIQTIELCDQMLHLWPDNVDLSSMWISFMNQILNTIAGNGDSWKNYDEYIQNNILPEEDRDDPLVRKIAKKAFISLMDELDISLDINRYHPGIYHHAAQYIENNGYWDFALKLEGLLRYIGYDISTCTPDCHPEDSLEEWLHTWSKLPQFSNLIFFSLTLCDEQNQPVKWFIPMPGEKFDYLCQFLEEHNCRNIMDGWQNGQKLFALTWI